METNRLAELHQQLDERARIAMARRTPISPILLQLKRFELHLEGRLCAPPRDTCPPDR
ncbi:MULTISPECIES: hypothetical protein [Sphingomonas]|uniref:hypothetical protein n=1 Tax=Sphingomonas TaxID=13687 RepID=UPI0012E2E6FA|nr:MULTISPECIES: hypothetical protein [Sphingomonas]USR00435.1 hypothetical protein NEF64_00765 [Sphingomonas aerolata]